MVRPSGANATLVTHVSVAHESSDLSAARRVPQPRRLVRGAGQDRAAVGREGHARHHAPWPSKRRISRPLAASHSRAVLSPEPVRIVRPSGANATLVTDVRVALEASDLAAARRIPQPRRLVLGAGEDGAAVGRERHARDPPWPSRRRISRPVAASQSRAVLSTRRSGEDRAAVGREGHARDHSPRGLRIVGSRGRSPRPTAAPSCPRSR